MARKPQPRLLDRKTVRGNRVPLPAGTVQKGTDDRGRLLYRNERLNEYWALDRIQGGWDVFHYSGDCGCGG